MGRTRYRIGEDGYPYLLTDTIVGWLPAFTRTWVVDEIFKSWMYLQENDDLVLLGYVVMENHIHWIAAAPKLRAVVTRFKSFTARQIINGLEEQGERNLLRQLRSEMDDDRKMNDYQLWQAGSKPKQMENEAMLRQKLEYIHNNPLKRGYVEQPEDWLYSSARNYARLSSRIEVCKDWA